MLPLPDTYAYDASGLRYRKTESINEVEVETFTVYTGNDILLEETYSEGAWKTARIEFTVAGASAGRFEKDYSTSQEAVRYYYQDHLGSRIGVTDEAGVVLATVVYDVWGNAMASGIAGYDAESEIRFTGKPLDATGLYYFNARYYDPQSKRFFTEDPIQQGMNWYTYCGNDPVNLRDPSGLMEVLDDRGDVVAVGDRAVDTRTGEAVDPDTGEKDPEAKQRGRGGERNSILSPSQRAAVIDSLNNGITASYSKIQNMYSRITKVKSGLEAFPYENAGLLTELGKSLLETAAGCAIPGNELQAVAEGLAQADPIVRDIIAVKETIDQARAEIKSIELAIEAEERLIEDMKRQLDQF